MKIKKSIYDDAALKKYNQIVYDDEFLASYYEQIGKNIRKLRKERKYTLKELGYLANIDYSYLNKIERGLHQPGLVTLTRISIALCVSMDRLLNISEFIDKNDENN